MYTCVVLQGYTKMGFVMERDAIVYREWAPGAANAQLIGDFNGWDGNAGQMTRDKFGTWEIRIPHGMERQHMRPGHAHIHAQVLTASPPSRMAALSRSSCSTTVRHVEACCH